MSKFFYVKPYNASISFRKDEPLTLNGKENNVIAAGKKALQEKLKEEDSDTEIGYCLNTHGLSNIFTSKHSGFKGFWFVLTIISASLSIFFIQQTLVEYFKYNVMTEVRIIDAEKGIEFPVTQNF
jgi:hypothetical protein